MAAPPLPREIQQLREQLLKDQAPSARSRTDYFDPGVFVARHGRPYSSLRLPINTLTEMRTDAILRFAQLVALVSIFTAKWRIECTNARKAAFIDKALRQIIGRLIVQFFESWNFGWQVTVKQFGLMDPGWQFIDRDAPGGPRVAPVWDNSPYPALVWEPFVPLRPSSVAPVWKADGSFNGVAISKSGVTGGYALPLTAFKPSDVDFIGLPPEINSRFVDANGEAQKIDVAHALWVVNERDGQWGSVWGYPRLGYAYKYWWAGEMTLGILNRSVERKGDPTVVVTYPQGSSEINGVEVPNQQIAFEIGERGRSGSILAVPSEVWGEDMGTGNVASKWSITYLKAEERFEELLKVLGYLDTMKFRSMMVSELAVAEGSGGTSSRNVAAVTGQRTAESQVFTMIEWDEIINRYMIPQLADANFPELRDVPARKVTQAFGEDEATLAAELLRSMANKDASGLPIDWKSMLDRFQIDALEGDALEAFEKRLVEQAQAAPPAPAEAKPNGPAGTTDTGLYYDAPELIVLEDDTLLASLPASKHYSDRAVLAQTRLLRRTWKKQLEAIYADFADYVASHEDLGLADKRAEDAVEVLVAGWRFAGTTLAATVKTTLNVLGKILARAGVVELSSSRIGTSAWRPEDKAIAGWVRDNVGAMVRSVDETTRAQLRTFLVNELTAGVDASTLAGKIRTHFADFPSWRADLIAREETKHFYNAGTLFAAEASGATQVQALDAQGDGPTDEDCEKRNGRLFGVNAAWVESAKEHIRGTLSWRIIPERSNQLSFTYRSREEMGDVAARFDQEERVVYLVEGIDPATAGRYLERAVEWLITAA